MLENWARATGFIAILVIALGGTLYWAFGDAFLNLPDCHIEKYEETAKASNQKTKADNETSINHLLPGQYNQQKPAEADHYYECMLADYTHQLAVFTKILAAATGVLALVTFIFAWFQFRDTRVLQRSYLGVAARGISPYHSGDGRLSCDVAFINTGHLPARNVSWYIARCFSNEQGLNDFHIPTDEEKFSGGTNLIMPGNEMKKGGPWIIHVDFDNFRRDNSSKPDGCWFYIWGRVRYKDGFNKNRFTDFCFRYSLRGSGGWNVDEKHARQHEYGNRTDED
jgi:hypothetical protein